ncbi:MAG TPA: hypothetical protein VNZ04_11490 [Trinickia sp.]|jgi:AmiR/NasT family two-component response regulator|nr:hypothetical protein [Trinickia sp.]
MTMFWLRIDTLPADAGLVLMAVRPETLSMNCPWLATPSAPPVIPVVTHENPITIEAVLQLNAFATIPSPLRSFGLLTAVAVALTRSKTSRARERYIERAASC